jgi:hypothetical protein
MLAGREQAPGSRFAGLSPGRGWQAAGKDVEPGLRMRGSGGRGQFP